MPCLRATPRARRLREGIVEREHAAAAPDPVVEVLRSRCGVHWKPGAPTTSASTAGGTGLVSRVTRPTRSPAGLEARRRPSRRRGSGRGSVERGGIAIAMTGGSRVSSRIAPTSRSSRALPRTRRRARRSRPPPRRRCRRRTRFARAGCRFRSTTRWTDARRRRRPPARAGRRSAGCAGWPERTKPISSTSCVDGLSSRRACGESVMAALAE